MRDTFTYTHSVESETSSVISAVYYDTEDNSMAIEFVSGRVYGYENVDYNTFREAIFTDSLGQWYNYDVLGAGIKSNNDSTEVDFIRRDEDSKAASSATEAEMRDVDYVAIKEVDPGEQSVYQVVWEADGKVNISEVHTTADHIAFANVEAALKVLDIKGTIKTVMRHYV